MIIAIDGTTSSGKGTLAKRLAAHYGLPHLDTGLLYRAVGKAAMDAGVDFKDEAACAAIAAGIDPAGFDERELRTAGVGAAASIVAVLGDVRRALFDLQRNFAHRPGGAVLDGRDIGTVIAPEAAAKLFVTASVDARAQRRFREMTAQGRAVSLAEIAADLAARDLRDRTRRDAPLVAAGDALLLDTSALGPQQAIAAAIALVEGRLTAA